MQDYQVIAMVIILGPMLRDIQARVQENVRKMMSGSLHTSRRATGCSTVSNSAFHFSKPDFIASCSAFGHLVLGVGLTIRVAAKTTEAVQQFLLIFKSPVMVANMVDGSRHPSIFQELVIEEITEVDESSPLNDTKTTTDGSVNMDAMDATHAVVCSMNQTSSN